MANSRLLPTRVLPPRPRPARAVTALATAGAAMTVLALAACGGSRPPAFTPGGPATGSAGTATATPLAQSSGPPGVTMPPFGASTHIVMTSWVPTTASLVAAVNADKDFELAYLYAEYTGGQSGDWASYVSAGMAEALRSALAAQSVTTESFTGTITFSQMSVMHDPKITKDVDVSACVDDAQALDTDIKTGKVLPGQSPSDHSYYQYTDELAPVSGGQWQVVGNYAPIYYPQAKECKP
jgi:hypothetical protein